MSDIIRKIAPTEHELLLRFLERAFRQEQGFFDREMPQWYGDVLACCSGSYVVESDGKIVSHVGLYPIEMTAAGVSLKVGGIGAVATAPEERGKGHMSRLLQHVIEVMRHEGYALSWLGGDRQRYNNYGWELAGLTYDLTITTRSLDWAAVKPAPAEECPPKKALPVVEALHDRACCWAERSRLAQQLAKQNIRFWITENGYAIVRGTQGEKQQILELVSTSHREPGLIRAILDQTNASEATWAIAACDRDRLARLMPYAAYWRSGPNGMYRMIDLALLLDAAKPYLRRWAGALEGCCLCLAIQEHDRTTTVTLAFVDSDVRVTPGCSADQVVELSIIEATRLLLGGPPTGHEAALPPSLRAALPLPVHILPLDSV